MHSWHWRFCFSTRLAARWETESLMPLVHKNIKCDFTCTACLLPAIHLRCTLSQMRALSSKLSEKGCRYFVVPLYCVSVIASTYSYREWKASLNESNCKNKKKAKSATVGDDIVIYHGLVCSSQCDVSAGPAAGADGLQRLCWVVPAGYWSALCGAVKGRLNGRHGEGCSDFVCYLYCFTVFYCCRVSRFIFISFFCVFR